MNRKRIALVMVVLLLPALAFSQSSTRGNQRVIPTYEISITANVRDAQVFINGQLQSRSVPATLTLAGGTYTIRIEAPGYDTWEERVVVNGPQTLRVTLRQPFATVILSIPREFLNDDIRNPLSQIDFYIDDRLERGARVQVRSGTHRVTIVSGGLKFESDVYFEAGMVYTLELILRLNLLQSVGAGR